MGRKTAWPRTRYPTFRKKVIVRDVRGKLVLQSWPTRRRGPRHPTNEYWTEWLKQADVLWNYTPDVFRLACYQAAKGSPQMPRDLAIACMAGRMWVIESEEGTVMYPMAAIRDVSESLDVLAQLKGRMLVRGDSLWIPLDPGLDKQVITFNAATGMPEYADPTGASSNYSAPLVASFPTLIGTPAPTLANSTPGPLVLGRAAAAAAPRVGAALRSLATTPHTYTYGLRHVAELVTNNRWGLVLRDSNTGRLVTFTYTMLTPTSTPRLQVDYWTNDTLWASTPQYRIVTHQNTLFLRVHDDGTNFVFSVASDDAQFQTLATLGRTAWLAAPDQQGFGVASGAVENIGSTLAAFHYHDE